MVFVKDVDAVWYFHSREGSAFVEAASAVNVKRTWVDYGLGKFTFDSHAFTTTDCGSCKKMSNMIFFSYITEIYFS